MLSLYKKTTLFVTHNIDEAYRLCERIIVMDKGSNIACQSKDTIFDAPSSVVVANLVGCRNLSRVHPTSQGEIFAADWGLTLTVNTNQPPKANVGIRPECIKLITEPAENAFLCTVASISESLYKNTLYVQTQHSDTLFRCDIQKDKWAKLMKTQLPLYIHLPKATLVFMD